jgi:hypothetical protein
MGGGRKGVRERDRGIKLIKVKYIHGWNTSRNPLNIDFGIKNERQDCKIDTV